MSRVIICEDDPILAMDLESAVESAGATVCGVFATAAEALPAAQAIKPDIALIDLTLADGQTGIDVAAALSRLGCKILVLSGGERTDGKLFSIRHTFISKPVPAPALAEILKSWAPAACRSSAKITTDETAPA